MSCIALCALYGVSHQHDTAVAEGASPPRAVAMKKAFREKIQRKKHKVLADSEFLPIFASQKDKVPWPSG